MNLDSFLFDLIASVFFFKFGAASVAEAHIHRQACLGAEAQARWGGC